MTRHIFVNTDRGFSAPTIISYGGNIHRTGRGGVKHPCGGFRVEKGNCMDATLVADLVCWNSAAQKILVSCPMPQGDGGRTSMHLDL